MKIEYFDTLPEIRNEYGIELEDNEKVVFTAKLDSFGTEKDSILGVNCTFTMTNKRIIVNNGVGIWTINILEDIVSCKKVESKFFFTKSVYFAIDLSKEIVFDEGRQKLVGFHFYFKKAYIAKFEEIINNIFN